MTVKGIRIAGAGLLALGLVGLAGHGVMAQAGQKVSAQIIPADQEDEFLKGTVSSKTPGVVLPKLKRQVDPKYTAFALRAKVEGDVKLEAIVGVDGMIEKSRVKESLHADLDAEALRTLSQWQFEPGRVNGQPARVLVEVMMTFRVK